MPIRKLGARAASNPIMQNETGRPEVNPPARSRRPDKEPPSAPAKSRGDNWTSDGEYIVGKNRPPLSTRWSRGQSGNPNGAKKKGVGDLESLTLDLLDKKITLTTSRGPETMSQGEALLRKLYEKAMKGDHKAALVLLEMQRRALERRAKDDGDDEGLNAAEQAMFDALVAAQSAQGANQSEDEA